MLLFFSVGGRADGIATLYSFSPATQFGGLYVNTDGWGPNGLIVGSDGYLWGTTFTGGKNATGVIFKVGTDGSMHTLHTFDPYRESAIARGINADGAQPYANLLLASDGNYYGVAAYGGRFGMGTLFAISPAGHFTRLFTFTSLNANGVNLDGANPFGSLIEGADGALYGTTMNGGKYGTGVIFRFVAGLLHPLSVLHAFSRLNTQLVNADGTAPTAALLQTADGSFYGTASAGGGAGVGTVYQIAPDGTFSVLYSFSTLDNNGANPDGANPQSALTQGQDGDLYGVAPTGGVSSNGTIFKIAADGTFTTVHSFSPTSVLINREGESPDSPLLLTPDGRFFGTTAVGGRQGAGTIFVLGLDDKVGALYGFGAKDANLRNLDGIAPNGLVFGANGAVYGSTYTGSANRSGTIFRLGPEISGLSPATVTALTAFTLTINGSGFAANDRIYWNGFLLKTTFVSSTQLTAEVPAKINTRQASYPATITISDTASSGFIATSTLTVTAP